MIVRPSIKLAWCGIVAGVLVQASSARATVVPSLSGATAGQNAFDTQISQTDLVNTGSFALSGTPVAPTSSLNPQFTSAGLNDGLAAPTGSGTSPTETYYQTTATPAVIIFTLNTGAGGSAAGYDVTGIKSIAGWSDSNIGAQSFELLLKTVAVPSFTSYGTFTNTSGFTSSTTSTSLASLTSLTDTTGKIAAGVTAVEFIYSSPANLSIPQGVSSGGTVVREIDVTGVASTPEPTSFAILGILSIGLFGRRRRA